jgi:ABC-type glycerol-3-phosphate transport system substrate-binding protein
VKSAWTPALLTTVALLAGLAAGCDAPADDGPKPIALLHSQGGDRLALMQEIVDRYNKTAPAIPVQLQYARNYTGVFQRTRANVDSGSFPDLVVAYKSMVSEYIAMDAVVPLGSYISDAEIGLSNESLADIHDSILVRCRFPAHGDRYYTFPFTTSVLMMYYNLDLLKKAGFDAPPKTWAEFREQCIAVSKLGGEDEAEKVRGYAISVDASTFDAMVYSFGGELLSEDSERVLFDQPAGVAVLKLLQDLVKAGAAHQIDRNSYGDRNEFINQTCAFFIRSSTSRPYIEQDAKGRFRWDMGVIPHAAGVEPVTVQFGGNIAVTKTTTERQRAAWQFVKYFVSKDVTTKWALSTGYLPVRKSAAESAEMQAFFAEDPRNRRAFDALPVARPEPGVDGWQAVRTLIEQAVNEAIGGQRTPEEIAKELTAKANAVLEKARRK